MPVLIRHGTKQWNNGHPTLNGCPFDPPLITGYSLDIPLNRPEMVVTSPFLRCRQTAELIANGAPIYIDSDLREYLGNWEKVWVLPETQRAISWPLIETFPQFNRRVSKIPNKSYYRDNVWIVTHGLVIKKVTGKSVNEGGYIQV